MGQGASALQGQRGAKAGVLGGVELQEAGDTCAQRCRILAPLLMDCDLGRHSISLRKRGDSVWCLHMLLRVSAFVATYSSGPQFPYCTSRPGLRWG